jgi:IS605 OrfB family transposase
MTTIKLPYKTSDNNKELIRNLAQNQNKTIKVLFNRIQENPDLKQTELTEIVNSLNNCPIDSWFKQSAVYKAKAIYAAHSERTKDILEYNEANPSEKKRLPTVIFGSRGLFFKRALHKIKKSTFQNEKLIPICSIGETLQTGNRKFKFSVIENNSITFKPNKSTHLVLTLPRLRKNYKSRLFLIQSLMEQKRIPVQVELDLKNIYINYDECLIQEKYSYVKNRVMTMDLNPNYLGWSVIDWKSGTINVLKTGIISLKKINDAQNNVSKSSEDPENLYWNNKRGHEILEISRILSEIAYYYKVEIVGLEDLTIKSKDNKKGSKYNRLVNNYWSYSIFSKNLFKRLNILGIRHVEVNPAYSSLIGNLLYREYPDPVCASVEISRRTYEYLNSHNKKPSIIPDFKLCKEALSQSLEEIGERPTRFLQDSKSWKDFNKKVKDSKLRYRVSLEKFKDLFQVFSLGHSTRSLVDCFSMI